MLDNGKDRTRPNLIGPQALLIAAEFKGQTLQISANYKVVNLPNVRSDFVQSKSSVIKASTTICHKLRPSTEGRSTGVDALVRSRFQLQLPSQLRLNDVGAGVHLIQFDDDVVLWVLVLMVWWQRCETVLALIRCNKLHFSCAVSVKSMQFPRRESVVDLLVQLDHIACISYFVITGHNFGQRQ